MKSFRLMGARLLGLFILPITAFANSIPIVDAGPDQYIITNGIALLQGDVTDPDGDPIVTYEWTVASSPAGSAPIIEWPYEIDPEFIGDTAGQYDLAFRASDGTDWSNPDSMSVFMADTLTPVANLSAIPSSGTAPLTVQFDSSTTIW